MVLVILLLLVAFIGLLAFMVGGIAAKDAKEREKTPQLLDTAFDGRPTVVYQTKVVGPQAKDVIEGAQARGYTLTGNVPGSYGTATLTFAKAPVTT